MGTLTPGKRADLTVVSLAGSPYHPVEDPAAAVVFGGSPERVLATIVDGQTRYRSEDEDTVARGTQHRKRRPAQNARAAAVTAAPKKQKTPEWQEELFFSRLRNHAKWAYVFLAVAFVLGFVLLGVGSGSNGLSDIFQSAFGSGSSSGGASIGSLQKKVDKEPQNATAWRDLATAYEQKQRTAGGRQRAASATPR